MINEDSALGQGLVEYSLILPMIQLIVPVGILIFGNQHKKTAEEVLTSS